MLKLCIPVFESGITFYCIYIFSTCMMVFLFLQHRDSGISRHSNKHERITRVQVKAHVRTYVSFVGRTHVHTGHGRRRVIYKNARIMNNAKFETICLTAFINPMKKLCHCSEISDKWKKNLCRLVILKKKRMICYIYIYIYTQMQFIQVPLR